jgi:hypothetical protein
MAYVATETSRSTDARAEIKLQPACLEDSSHLRRQLPRPKRARGRRPAVARAVAPPPALSWSCSALAVPLDQDRV